ncbi:GNAT family N-acetyltransferase [Paenibacillus sp. GD4]|jgi:N-acetylglutamate synthase|uniref:GNAT family N-acetyltransferase n=1 Tax=Paenibacillus sp. GD4 TaxID=3068890 RepID=UPI0027964310|nr:GNAT family N-acetyltransferase [Paenibacillus sp. GD4]MDQ1911091.1 GNAT family N-acetyltransferase [Paenibacillus sp. GD4]
MSRDRTMNRIRNYEERLLNAWPTLQTFSLEGWQLRYGMGYSKRANSVQPLYWAGDLALEAAMDQVEGFYRQRGLPVIYKITEASEPKGLDAVLADRGYEQVDLVSVQTARLEELPLPRHSDVVIETGLTEAWLESFCRMNPSHARHRDSIKVLFRQHLLPCGYAAIRLENRTVACGLAVLQGSGVGIFDIVADPDYRRQGLGESLLLHLLGWAKGQGAQEAYLQVLADNTAARRLYAKLGFQEAYQQWYRVKSS